MRSYEMSLTCPLPYTAPPNFSCKEKLYNVNS